MVASPGDSFVHLHVHTEYSMLDGAARLTDLFSTAARMGMPAVAMTDHGNLFGAYDFYKTAQAHGVKPIIGLEGYYAPQGRFERRPFDFGGGFDEASAEDPSAGRGKQNYAHMTVWAENTPGMHNLFRLSSLASLEGYFYKPRFDRELLQTYGKGLIATTGCPSGEVNRWLQAGNYARAVEAAADFRDILGRENFFVEVMDHGLAIERRFREDLIRLARDLDLPLVATNDLHYVNAGDADTHDVLLCIGTRTTMDDPKRFRFDARDFYLKSPAEMRSVWSELPEACDNTLLIAERCEVSFAEGANLMPVFPVPDGETEESWLVAEVERGLALRFPGGVPDGHRRQASYEVGVICQMGFPGYFLVVADLVRYAKENGIRVGPGRGSAAGALIAYALGITDLDPIKHGLLFERFLNPERVSMPDIDMDFDERRRGDMIRYATEKYGEERVAQIVTYGSIKAKAAIKDSARVLGYPYALGDRITKAMPPSVMGKDIPLSGVFDREHPRWAEAAEFRALCDGDADVRRVVDTARGLEGLKRQPGVHAAGVILCREPLLDVVPVWRREQDGAVITQFDMGACESLGLLKMDFLGLRNLTVLDDCLRHIASNRGETLVLEDLELDDRPTYELLTRGDTLGVFQLDGGPMRSLLRSMQPDNFEDISAVLALYRPGPMGANAHNEYADRKNGRKPVVPIHPELAEPLEEILGESYGLCVTGDTLVWDADTGFPTRIDAIADRVAAGSFRTYGVDHRGVAAARAVTHWVPTGEKPVLKVTTRSGHELRLSADHPVLTPGGWRKAGELTAGVDRLALPRTSMPPAAAAGGLSPDEARFLGYLLGDGYLSLNQNNITSGSPELLAEASRLARHLFPDVHPVLRDRSGYPRRDGRRGSTASRVDFMASPEGSGRGRGSRIPGGRYQALSLNRWLRGLGFTGVTRSGEKFVPEAVFRSDDDSVVAFLAGLWDTDGHIDEETAFVTTVSAALAVQVHSLLSRLGIVSRRWQDQAATRASGRSVFRVHVYGERFWDLVVPYLVVPEKARVVKRRTRQARFGDGINAELMIRRMTPIVLADDRLAPQARTRLLGRGSAGIAAIKSFFEREHGVDLATTQPQVGADGAYLPMGRLARFYLETYGDDEDHLYANQHWSVIESIVDDGVEPMYDITVDGIHTFVANGLVVHNCIYQEQVMAIAQQLAGYSLGKADLLRRAMGKKKKEILDKEFVPFRDGMRSNGYSDGAINTLWEILVPFSDYAFNKAHTAGYGLVSYWTAFLKANYPAEYMAALLTSVKDDKDKSAVYLNECRRMGIKVLPPDVNDSDSDFTPRGGDIRFGLSAIRNVGANVVESIVATRRSQGRFADFPDFIAKVEASVCNKRVVESLVKAGAFDSLGHTRKGLLQVHEQVIDNAVEVKRAEAIGQFDLFGGLGGADDGEPAFGLDVAIPLGEWDKPTLLAYEREMLGLYVSDHPLHGVEHVIASATDCSIASLLSDERADGSVVTVGGLVTSVQRKTTKQGSLWAIVTLEDLEGGVDVMVFPQTYQLAGPHLVDDSVVLVRGRIDRGDEDGVRLVAMEITVPDLSEAPTGPVRVTMPAARCAPPTVDRLKEVLTAHPGVTEVHLHLQNGPRTTVLRLDDRLRVTPSPALYGDLKALLGPACLG